MFKDWTDFLQPMYKKKRPLPTRPIRCLYVNSLTPRLVYHCSNFCGSYSSHEVIVKNKKQKEKKDQERDMPIEDLKVLYKAPIPISGAKYNGLQSLSRLPTNPEAKSFYNLTWDGRENNEQHDDVYFDFISNNDD